VSTRAATVADADFTQGKVKVIVDDEEVIKIDLKFLYQSANCLPALVHIGLGPGYYHLAASYFTCADAGETLLFIKPDTLRPGKMLETHKAYIMAVTSIISPRITQTYN
jgi:hypothetical protein